MALFHIKEIFNDDQSITLQADGRLDDSSIPILNDVCQRHLRDGRKVILNTEGLHHISREGRNFLDAMKDKVILEKLPSFIRLK